jgi:hypothetical protein
MPDEDQVRGRGSGVIGGHFATARFARGRLSPMAPSGDGRELA